MNITDKFLKDHPRIELRFITSPTPAMRAEAAGMAKRAKDIAIEVACCGCVPWNDCEHRDPRESERWWLRGWKLDHANDDALMKVFSAPVQDVWPVVDRLVACKKGVCRP